MTELQTRSVLYLEAIKQIVAEIARFDALQPLLNHVVSSVQRELDFYIASIFWYDAAHQRATLLAQDGQSPAPMPLGYVQPIDAGVVGLVLRQGIALCIDDVRLRPDYVAPTGYAAAASELCVPIVSDGRLWGAFNVESTVPAAFTHNDQLALEVIAAQLGSAIYNLDLRARQQRSVDELQHEHARQEVLLDEVQRLGTPIFPIAAGALALPLIGTLDDARMQRVADTLLAAVQRTRSSAVLVDITGVAAIDAAVAQHLLRLGHMVRLLGAELVLTGVRPEVAQTLVALHADLTGLSVRPDFAAGMQYALHVARRATVGSSRR